MSSLDFKKAFDTISHKIPKDKLLKFRLDKQTVRWLNGHAHRVISSGMNSSWKPVTTGVPQWLILSAILFNIFISQLGDGADCTLSKFADDTELGGKASSLEGRAATQRDRTDWRNQLTGIS